MAGIWKPWSRYLLILSAFLALVAVTIVLWSTYYKQFAQRKEIKYLSCAYAFDEFFTDPGLTSLDRCLASMHPIYPPLYFFLLRTALALFGESYAAFLSVNVVMIFILILAVYAVGAQLFNPPVGFTAALLLLCTPQIAVYSKLGTHALPISATTALGAAIMVSRKRLGSYKSAFLVGSIFSVALLMKWDTVVYLGPLYLYLLAKEMSPTVKMETRVQSARQNLLTWLVVIAGPLGGIVILGAPWQMSVQEGLTCNQQVSWILSTILHLLVLWLVLWLYLRILVKYFTNRPEPLAAIITFFLQVLLLISDRGPFHRLLPLFYDVTGGAMSLPLPSLARPSRSWLPPVDLSTLFFLAPSLCLLSVLAFKYPRLRRPAKIRINIQPFTSIVLAAMLGLILTSAIFGSWVVRYLDRTEFTEDIANETGIHYGYQLFYPFSLIYMELSLLLSPLVLGLSRSRTLTYGVRFVAVWYFIPLIIFSYLVLYDKEPYRMLPALAGMTLLIAAGLDSCARWVKRSIMIGLIVVGVFFHTYPFMASKIRISRIPGLSLLLGGPELMFSKFILDPPPPDKYVLSQVANWLDMAGLTGKIMIVMSSDLVGERFMSQWNIEYYQLMLKRQGWDVVFVLADHGGGEALQNAADLLILSEQALQNNHSHDCALYRPVMSGWNPMGELLCELTCFEQSAGDHGDQQPITLDGEKVAGIVAQRMLDGWNQSTMLVAMDHHTALTTLSFSQIEKIVQYSRARQVSMEFIITNPEVHSVLLAKTDLIIGKSPSLAWLDAPSYLTPSFAGRRISILIGEPETQRVTDGATQQLDHWSLAAAWRKYEGYPPSVHPKIIPVAEVTVHDNPYFMFDFLIVNQPAKRAQILVRRKQ